MTKKEKSQKMDYEKLMRKHRIMEETIKEHLERYILPDFIFPDFVHVSTQMAHECRIWLYIVP